VNRRALFIALVVGAFGVVLLVLYQRRFEMEASGGEKVRLLMAVKRIERGKAVTEDVIAVREIPLAYVDDRSIREADKNKILGLKVGTTVREQQLLLWSDVTSADERRDLSSLVLPGYRAVSIRAARDDGSISMIRPGDYVDVISVVGGTGAGAAAAEAKNAVVLLQRVLVLAAGGETSAQVAVEDKKPNLGRDSVLTLSLTLAEAQLIALASERGRLAVAVRHPDDQQRTQGIPDVSVSQFLSPDERIKLKGIRGNSGPVDISAKGHQ
jgi:pilus assembly protein CpaB